MGREVRRVPANWQHPRGADGNFIPLHEGRDVAALQAKWDAEEKRWNSGFAPDYMPNWPEAERTHLQMYEDETEGTPISPVMETPEELARWLSDTNASAFGYQGATYEEWLATIRRGWAPSAVFTAGKGLRSGVEDAADA